MKTTLMSLCFFCSTVFVASAFATEQLPVGNSREVPFVTLKNVYDGSKDNIAETDVDLASNASSQQKCVFSSEAEKEKIYSFNLLRFESEISGQPANGPLFPGTPATKTNTFMINREATRTAQLDLWENFAKTGVKTASATQIQVLITHNDLSDSPVQVTMKKSKALVTVEVIIFKGLEGQKTAYGYCYKQ